MSNISAIHFCSSKTQCLQLDLSILWECSLNPMRKALRNITSEKSNLIYGRKFSFRMVTLYISPKSVFPTILKKIRYEALSLKQKKKKSLSIVGLKIPDPGKTIYLALFSFYSLRKKIFSVEKMVNLSFIPPETSPGISSWQLNLNHDSEQRCVFLEALL